MNDKLTYLIEDIQLKLIDFKSYLKYKIAVIKRYFVFLGKALSNKTHHIIDDVENNVAVWHKELTAVEEQFNELWEDYKSLSIKYDNLVKKTKKPKK